MSNYFIDVDNLLSYKNVKKYAYQWKTFIYL